MTGLDIYNKAMMLLGYDQNTVNQGATDEIMAENLRFPGVGSSSQG